MGFLLPSDTNYVVLINPFNFLSLVDDNVRIGSQD